MYETSLYAIVRNPDTNEFQYVTRSIDNFIELSIEELREFLPKLNDKIEEVNLEIGRLEREIAAEESNLEEKRKLHYEREKFRDALVENKTKITEFFEDKATRDVLEEAS